MINKLEEEGSVFFGVRARAKLLRYSRNLFLLVNPRPFFSQKKGIGMDKIHELEKRLMRLEEDVRDRLDEIDEDFRTFKEVIERLQGENKRLKHRTGFPQSESEKETEKIAVTEAPHKFEFQFRPKRPSPMFPRIEILPKERVAKPTVNIREVASRVHDGVRAEVAENIGIVKKLIAGEKKDLSRFKEELEEYGEKEKAEKGKFQEEYKEYKKSKVAEKKKPETRQEKMLQAKVDGRIETPIDRLYELVSSKGSVRLSDVAKMFGVHEVQVEEWAKILEEHDLIEVDYPAIGKPLLKKKKE